MTPEAFAEAFPVGRESIHGRLKVVITDLTYSSNKNGWPEISLKMILVDEIAPESSKPEITQKPGLTFQNGQFFQDGKPIEPTQLKRRITFED